MTFKRIFVVSLTALSLLLANCGGSDLQEPSSQEYETIVGEFKSLAGIKVDAMITHLFEDDDGNIYYAFSDRYDLDEELNTRIEAAGLVMEYEDLDKPAFKITRISEASEDVDENAEVTMVDYVDTDLGFKLSYPDNWTFESFRDSIQLTAPIESTDEEEEGADKEIEPDVIIVAYLDADLRTTSDDEMDERALDVQTQASLIYPDIIDLDGQVTMIGEDQQFAVRYKTESGNIYYFIPRGKDILELSFYHPSEESAVTNANIFSEIVTSFQFLPQGEDGEFIHEDSSSESENLGESDKEDEPEDIKDSSSITSEQVSVGSFREFESSPYKFKISYPGSWYYSGGNKGYDFSIEPIEDDGEALLRLDINSTTSTGVVRTGTSVKITVEVEGQYYTLSGPAEYETVMQEMVDTIAPVDSDEA